MYRIDYTATARKDLMDLDRSEAQRIAKKIGFFARQENIGPFCKMLQGFDPPTYRFRIGNYRVLFDLSSSKEIKILNILRIKHRKDIYDL